MADDLLKQLESGEAPVAIRMAIAEGMYPLESDQMIQALGYLVHDPESSVRESLQANMTEMPKGFLVQAAAGKEASAKLLHEIAKVRIDDEEVLQPVILNRKVMDQTLVFVAENGPPSTLEILAQNRNRMLENPLILKKLLENDLLSRVTRYSLAEFRERFDIDLDVEVIYEDESEMGESAVAEPAETEIETVPEDVESEVDDAVAEKISSETIDADLEDIDLTEDELTALERGIETDVYEDEDASEFEQTAFDEADVEGESDEWDIEGFVKNFKSGETKSESSGFDDALDITLEDEASSSEAEQEWLGESVSELGRKYGIMTDDAFDDDDEEAEKEKEKMKDTRVRLMGMGAAEKLIMAQLGTKQERNILVTDPNKKVAVAVVEGPKMSEFEIQLIAGNRQVYEDVLRAIAKHRKWGKSVQIRRELVLNPKTPLDLTVRMLSSLNDFTLRDVVKSKEIPSALAAQAKRVLEMREKRRSG
jgi:hypothetical protein